MSVEKRGIRTESSWSLGFSRAKAMLAQDAPDMLTQSLFRIFEAYQKYQ